MNGLRKKSISKNSSPSTHLNDNRGVSNKISITRHLFEIIVYFYMLFIRKVDYQDKYLLLPLSKVFITYEKS